MNKEIERLSLHREIIEGKLAIPSNEATRAVFSKHLARIDAQIAKCLAPRMKPDPLEQPDPLERVFVLQAQYKRFGKYWTPQERQEHRRKIREARIVADGGIVPPRWKPLSDEAFAACKERVKIIIAKYKRVPA